MKLFTIFLFSMLVTNFTMAQQKLSMSFNNEDLSKIIDIYAKASGQKFILDPGVRGKITIILPDLVTTEEAYNHLSTALAINGYAISKQGDTLVVKSARNIQRDLIEVSTQKPNIKPERMYTWIYKPKHLSAESIARELRILNSKDGELTTNTGTNQLIISDWVSNINRIADLLTEIDKPVDAATARLVDAGRKERDQQREHQGRSPKAMSLPKAPEGQSE